MMRLVRRIATTAASAALACACASGGESRWRPPEDSPFAGSLSLSFVQTGGKTDARTLSVGFEGRATRSPWRQALSARATLASADGVRSTDSREAICKAERFLSRRAFGYLRAAGFADDVEGVYLRATAGAGAGRRLVAAPPHELSAELGYEFMHEALVEDDRNQSFARGALAYSYRIGDGRAFEQKAEVSYGQGRTRVRAESALSAKFSGGLAARLGFLWEHDSEPPPTSVETTTRSEAALVWSF